MSVRVLYAQEDLFPSQVPDRAVLYDSVTGIPLMLEVFSDTDDGVAADDLANAFVNDARVNFQADNILRVDASALLEFQSAWLRARHEGAARE